MTSPDEHHAHARAEFAHAFPALPLRIITSVLTAYTGHAHRRRPDRAVISRLEHNGGTSFGAHLT